MIRNKMEKVMNIRKNVNNQAILMKSQIKNRISGLKATQPDKISKVIRLKNMSNLFYR